MRSRTQPILTRLPLSWRAQGHHGTRLYDALVSSAEWLAKQSPDERKFIFVFSDGDDNASQSSLPETIAALQRTQIPVIVVAPSVVEHKPQGKNLRQLATRTGGHAYFLQQNKDFDFTLMPCLDETAGRDVVEAVGHRLS